MPPSPNPIVYISYRIRTKLRRAGVLFSSLFTTAQSLRSVFVAINEKSVNAGTFKHRGVAVANLLGQDIGICGRVEKKYDIYVHIKWPCNHLRNHSGWHVLDVLDNPRTVISSLHFNAEIFQTNEDITARCSAPVCAKIPHHFNMKACLKLRRAASRARSDLSTTEHIGIVGTARNYDVDNLQSIFHDKYSAKVVFVREREGFECEFLLRITFAIAWVKLSTSTFRKGGERFTNPIRFGIRTIGHAAYPAFNEYGQTFLCNSSACALNLYSQIRNGSYDNEFEDTRRRIIQDTSPSVTRARYMQVFRSIETQAPSSSVQTEASSM